MAGLISTPQSAAQQPEPQTENKISDPILQKIQKQIEAKVPPDLKKDYLAVVVAGMKVMFSPETSNLLMDRLKASDDVVKNVSSGIADLLALLYQESGQKMSVPAAMFAAIVLMCQALDVAEKTMGIQITPDMAAACAEATAKASMAKFGIDDQKVQQTLQKG